MTQIADATSSTRFERITLMTERGPEESICARFGPFAVNITGIEYEEIIPGVETDHRLLCGVTHVATGYLIQTRLYDESACALALRLARDHELCGVFDTDDPHAVRGRFTEEQWDRLRGLVLACRELDDAY